MKWFLLKVKYLLLRYGCCLDGVTPAQGFGRAGCPDYQRTVEQHPPPPPPPPPTPPSTGDVCSLQRDDGPCDTWMVRFYYDSGTHRYTEFWYGGCQGNANNFVSLEECQRKCDGVVRGAPRESPPTRVTPRRRPTRSSLRA
ncbi:hypothetical protein LDENG_00215820 [Lucifuga dentata]|nr:hypothetical protein LDENG_00215820 [Lucifuga dentata]